MIRQTIPSLYEKNPINCQMPGGLVRLWTGTLVLLSLWGCQHTGSKSSDLAPRAEAPLVALTGTSLKGTILFIENRRDEIEVTADITGIKTGPHGFHIHLNGDCSAADFASAGGHYNPEGTDHGSISSPTRHRGDMGNLLADNNNTVKARLLLPLNPTSKGLEDLYGKSIIIHEGLDDLKSQPAGNSGKRIACGVIQKK